MFNIKLIHQNIPSVAKVTIANNFDQSELQIKTRDNLKTIGSYELTDRVILSRVS